MEFGVWVFGFKVWVLGFGVWGLRFGVWSLGFGVWVLSFGVLGYRIWGLRLMAWDVGFSIQGWGSAVERRRKNLNAFRDFHPKISQVKARNWRQVLSYVPNCLTAVTTHSRGLGFGVQGLGFGIWNIWFGVCRGTSLMRKRRPSRNSIGP